MRREKKNESSRSVTQCNAAHAIQAFVLVLSAFSSACVHSLLLEPCNRTNTPTTVNFQLKLDVCGKVTSRLLLSFLLMRITIRKMKRKITEKPQNLNSNAPEFIWKCNNLLKSHQCGQVPYTHTHTSDRINKLVVQFLCLFNNSQTFFHSFSFGCNRSASIHA